MAHPSSYVSVAPDRSRSRDDPPMRSHPTPDRPRIPHHQESWHYTPSLRHTRRVLVIINLEQVQHLMLARHSDAMQATTCSTLPSLGRLEQYALFTYIASWSIQLKPNYSRLTLCSTTSVSISTTPGASTWNLHQWIFAGKIVQETPSLYAIIRSSLTCYVNTVHTGLKAKNLGSWMKFGIWTIPINHTLCAWVTTRHFQTQTCYRDSLPTKGMSCWMHVVPPSSLSLILSFCPFHVSSGLLASVLIMTKRDSSFAGIDSPRVPMSVPRRHFAIRFQHGSGAASSETASSSALAIWHEPSSTTWWNRNECGSSSHRLYGDDPSCSFTTWIYIRPPRGSISITIGNVTKSSGASHSHFQGSNVASRVRPSQSPNGDGGWSLWSWMEPSTGILLQWNCWSCALLWWRKNQ